MRDKYTVWLIGPDLQPAGKIQASRVSAVLRWAETGSWTAQILGEAPNTGSIRAGCRVILLDDTGEVFSGPITTIDRSRLQSGVMNLNLSGKTDSVVLSDRLVYPDPLRQASAQRTDYYTDTGPVGMVIAALVMRNAGASALPERSTPGLIVDRRVAGPAASVRARFTNLRQEIGELERQHQVRVVSRYLRQQRKIKVAIEATVDRSRSMVLRQRTGVIGESSVSTTAPSATSVVLAGDGEGVSRRIASYDLPRLDWWGARRVEEFKDRRDTKSDAELAEAWEKLRADIIGSAAVTTKVRERPGQIFGQDYHLGDRVSIELGGQVFTDPVQSAQLTWDEAGRTVQVTVGQKDAQDSPAPSWVRRIRKLEDDLRILKGK